MKFPNFLASCVAGASAVLSPIDRHPARFATFAVLLALAVLGWKRRVKRQVIDRAWTTALIEEHYNANPRPALSFQQQLLDLICLPNKKLLFAIAGALVLTYIGPLIVIFLLPSMSRTLPNTNPFESLWQVQAGISGVALPVLVFVIELAKDERSAARTSEVLLRYTFILPIILFTLAIQAKFSIDAWSTPRAERLYTDALLHIVSLFLTGYAYYMAIDLMSNRAITRQKSIELLKERMQRSVIYTLETRIGRRLTERKLKENGISIHPLSVGRDERRRFYQIDADRPGRIADINHALLAELYRSLPWKTDAAQYRSASDVATAGPKSFKRDRPRFLVNREFREFIVSRNRALVLIEKDAIESFDRAQITERVRRCFKILTD